MADKNQDSIPIDLKNLSNKLGNLIHQLELNLGYENFKLIVWDVLFLDLAHFQFNQTQTKELALMLEHLDENQWKTFISNLLLISASNSLGYKLNGADLKEIGLDGLNIYLLDRFMERMMDSLQKKDPVIPLDMGMAVLEMNDVLRDLANKIVVDLPNWARMDLKYSA